MKFTAIIPAAGSGSRFGGHLPKQFMSLRDQTVLSHTIRRILSVGAADRVVLAVAPSWLDHARGVVARESWDRVEVVEGGATRQESVAHALHSLAALEDREVVAVHDSVRPFVSRSLINRLVAAAGEFGAACPVVPVTDTVHRNDGAKITGLVDRFDLGLAQTPQCFHVGVLRSVIEFAVRDNVSGTDEAGLAARYGFEVKVIAGEPQNMKITTSGDLDVAEAMFDTWSRECSE